MVRHLMTSVVVPLALAVHAGCSCDASHGIAERWGISEPPFQGLGNILAIPLGDGGMQVWITRDAKTKTACRVDLLQGKEGAIFSYKQAGIFGTPEADYGSGIETGKQLEWMDLNADGQFDVRMSFAEDQVYILLEEQWVKVRGREGGLVRGPVGQDGTKYRFNVAWGRWETARDASAEPKR